MNGYWLLVYGFISLSLFSCTNNLQISQNGKPSPKEDYQQKEVTYHIENYQRQMNMRLQNKYLNDIQYSLSPTSRSFVAVGEKIPVKNGSYGKSHEKTLAHCLVHSSNKTCQKWLEEEEKIHKIETKSLRLESKTFAEIADWDSDNFEEAMESFVSGCAAVKRYAKNGKPIKTSELQFGKIEEWQKLCELAKENQGGRHSKNFFERNFTPFAVTIKNKDHPKPLFTGYYEFGTKGSLKPNAKYRYPLYIMPPECKNQQHKCYSRKTINDGILNNRGLEICWLDDPVELWQLQIQGSGLVDLGNGTFLRVGFGGTNKKSYQEIWDKFPYQKLPPNQRNRNGAMAWLREHGKQALNFMNLNPSYTFFIPNNKEYTVGARMTKLIPSRVVAVDYDFIPYGVPLWISTKLPVRNKQISGWLPLRRLVMAQDTGKAIKGPARMDIFFGHGEKAHYLAHNTRFNGDYYILLPKTIIPHISKIKS